MAGNLHRAGRHDIGVPQADAALYTAKGGGRKPTRLCVSQALTVLIPVLNGSAATEYDSPESQKLR